MESAPAIVPAPYAHPAWLLASPTIALIAGALASAQGEMGDATKDRQNSHFGSNYADLASVVQAVRGPLSKHGIAFMQLTGVDGGRVVVRTILTHKSGEWVASELSARPQQDTPQGIGSTLTYLRRYGLMSMTGIAPDDDDGEAGEGRGGGPAPKPPKRTREQIAETAREKEAEREAARAQHHPSFDRAEQARFGAFISEHGIVYDDLCRWLASPALGRPRPSQMDQDARTKLVLHLQGPGKSAYTAFLAREAGADAGPSNK